jgi:serine phosphatase RsbU (regulator of sigma subunit)
VASLVSGARLRVGEETGTTSSLSERRAAEDFDSGAVAEGSPGGARSARGGRSLLWLPAAVLIIGLLVTAALTVVSQRQYANNEKRLLHLRVRDAGALIAEALPGLQTPLASAAALADATNGNPRRFTRFAAVYVGSRPGQFASLSLWRVSAAARGPVAVEGLPPKLAQSRSLAAGFFTAAARRPELGVIGLLSGADPRLGFVFAEPTMTGGYAVYGENRLPASRRSRLQSSNQFAGLHYAIYLGAEQNSNALLVSDVAHQPLPGRKDHVVVPFGSTAYTLVMSTRGSLSGSLPQQLPWIIAIVGGLLSLAAAAVASVLVQRRRSAERRASENRALYAEQRSIAQTLQHALLPTRLPQIPGVQTSGRYEAGELGVDVGGDWYDVIDLGERRLLIVIGDVTGRGLAAAATMARLRFAIQAYAHESQDPAAILTKLSGLVSVAEGGQLATILCAAIDVDARTISTASAGHLPPLLLHDGDGYFVEGPTGMPIGVEPVVYQSVTVSAPAAATLIAFTDGLVEQRGEHLDRSLDLLRRAASGRDAALPELLRTLVFDIQGGSAEDDIAIVGLRWTS